MNRTLILVTLLTLIIGVCSVGLPTYNLYADTANRKDEVQKAVDLFLKEKKKTSGTLDLFDESINKVRNLNFMTIHMDSLADKGSRFKVDGDLRDIGSGEIVDVSIDIGKENDTLSVREIKIIGVKEQPPAQKEPEMENKKFTAAEAVAAMAVYIEKMSKFGGTFGLVDTTTEKYRQLKLVGIDEKVRNFGILYISTVEFIDVDTKEKVVVDMTLYNKEGQLDIKSVRIKKIIKP